LGVDEGKTTHFPNIYAQIHCFQVLKISSKLVRLIT